MSSPSLKEPSDSDPGDATKWGAPDAVQCAQLIKGTHATEKIPEAAIKNTAVTLGTANQVITAVKIFNHQKLTINNPATTFQYIINASAIVANRNLTIPLLTGDDTIGVLGLAQTFLAAKTFTTGLLKVDDIADSGGAKAIVITPAVGGTPVNWLVVNNALTGVDASITVAGESNRSLKLLPSGTGVIYGNREIWDYALSDETTALTTGVKVTDGIPYDFKLTDVQVYLTTPGTGATLFTVDVLYESGQNTNSFSTIFSTKPTVDASEYTSVTAATPKVLSTTSLSKGRRLQYKIQTLDSNSLAKGVKIALIGYATAV